MSPKRSSRRRRTPVLMNALEPRVLFSFGDSYGDQLVMAGKLQLSHPVDNAGCGDVSHLDLGDHDDHGQPHGTPVPEGLDFSQGAQTDGPLLAEAGAPLSALPLLHSRPGATVKVFIDLDGAPAMTWGGQPVPATPAFDQDGDPTTFSASELTAIDQLWKRVAEKFSPFNVDVTTQDPGTYPGGVVVRAVVGGNGSWYGAGVGGVGYVGAFSLGAGYNTVWVFSNNLGNLASYSAEAVAHEVGHNFGLSHQSAYSGTTKTSEYRPGNALVGPVMGNSYYSARGLWTLGPSSAGSTSIQDDLQIISTQNGFGYRADDYGNNAAAAFTLTPSGQSVSASGVIERTSDQDWFSFTTPAGTVNFTLAVPTYGAMLDGTLTITSADGSTVLAAADTASLGETLSLSLPAGTYRAVVSSKGSYGDIGQFTLSGTLAAAVAPVAAPSNVTAARSGSNVNVTWTDNATNETAYKVERSTDGGATWSTIVAGLAADTGVYTDSTAAVGLTYTYRVTAYNGQSSSTAVSSGGVAMTPNAPAGLTASAASATQINLSWFSVAGANGYLVERSTDGGSTWTTAGTVFGTSFSDTGRAGGSAYAYRVKATSSGAGNSAASNTASALTLPLAPTTLSATAASSTRVDLSWTNVAGESGYKVERSTDGGATWSLLTTTSADVTTFADTSAGAGLSYAYRVRAFNASGDGANASASVTTPAVNAPGSVVATVLSSTAVRVTWADVPGETGFRIERSGDGGATWATAGTVGAGVLTFDSTQLVPATTYVFRVRATSAGGDSATSNTATVTMLPSAPAALTATAVAPTRVNLAWSTVTGAGGYKIERSTDGGSTWSALTTTASATYADTAAATGVTYTYRVKAYNVTGDSASSPTATTTPTASLNVLSPTNLIATLTAGGTQVALSWTDNASNESAFTVQRSANGGVTWTDLATLGSNATAYTDTTTIYGTAYAYRVCAANQWVTSGDSNTATATTVPAAVTTLTVFAKTDTTVTLAWTDVAGETGYRVERYVDDVTGWQLVATVGATASHTVTGLTAASAYTFRVSAINAGGAGTASSSVTVTTTPAAPASLTATAASHRQVDLAWSAATGATAYEVARSTDGGATWTTVTTTTNLTFSDTTVAGGVTYTYRVRATGAGGPSASSPLAVVPVPAAPAIEAPTAVTATLTGAAQITLGWTNPSNAARVVVERAAAGSTAWVQIADLAAPTASFVDDSLGRGASYVYRLVAYTAAGQSSAASATTPAVLTIPADVTGLRLTGSTGYTISLAWTNVKGNAGYVVEQSTNRNTWTTAGTTAANTASYMATGLNPTTRYYFRVRSSNAAGASAPSTILATSTLTSTGELVETGIPAQTNGPRTQGPKSTSGAILAGDSSTTTTTTAKTQTSTTSTGTLRTASTTSSELVTSAPTLTTTITVLPNLTLARKLATIFSTASVKLTGDQFADLLRPHAKAA